MVVTTVNTVMVGVYHEISRQINSFYYERLLATQKECRNEVANEVFKLEPKGDKDYTLKGPFVLEFLGLKESAKYTESQLEQGLIDRIFSALQQRKPFYVET